MDFGNIFKEAREKKGLSLEAIEEGTKIRKLYLKAIEEETFNTLPPKVYATGFVKQYARFLGLNENEMVEEFKSLAYANEEEEEENISIIPMEENDSNINKSSLKKIFIAISFLLIAIWVGNMLVDFIADRKVVDRNQISAPPTQQSQNKTPSKEHKQSDKTAPVKNELNIKISATQNCWLLVVVDDKQEFNATLASGQQQSFTGKKSVYIKAGNAGGIELTRNGKKIAPIGKNGEVIEKTFLLNEE